MASSVSSLENCMKWKRLEYERYYETVLLTLGIKRYLEKTETGCRFVYSEPRFYTEDGSEVKPDIVLQYDDDKRGILCEIKTSLPPIDPLAKLRLKPQLERYSKDVKGWDTPVKWVQDHDILLLVHAQDSNRVTNLVQEWIDKGELKLTKDLCIAEWSLIQSMKFPGLDIILIKHKFGKVNCHGLQQHIEKNISFNIQELTIEYNKCRFTRKEPPVCYTMDELWGEIFTAFVEESEDFDIELDQILKIAYEYYIPWSGLDGEFSQVRKTWIRKALSEFCEINLAKKIGKEKYRIHYGKNIQKDRIEYFIRRLCRKEIEKSRKARKPRETVEEMQRLLSEF